MKIEKSKFNHSFYEKTLLHSDPSWLSPTYLDWGSKKGYYVLSTDVNPVFGISNKSIKTVFHFIPKNKIRIHRDQYKLGDSSFPVRTPSFMPMLVMLYPISKSMDTNKPFYYTSVLVAHHSNGQDGNATLPNGKNNTVNGNFATNFFELSLIKNFKSYRKINFIKNKLFINYNKFFYYSEHYFKYSFEQHFGQATPQLRKYGGSRINFRYGYINVIKSKNKLINTKNLKRPLEIGDYVEKEKYRIILNASLIVQPNLLKPYSKFEKRFSYDATYYLRILNDRLAWFFTVGYYGTDPYNIYYDKQYPFIRTGLAMGNFLFQN